MESLTLFESRFMTREQMNDVVVDDDPINGHGDPCGAACNPDLTCNNGCGCTVLSDNSNFCSI